MISSLSIAYTTVPHSVHYRVQSYILNYQSKTPHTMDSQSTSRTGTSDTIGHIHHSSSASASSLDFFPPLTPKPEILIGPRFTTAFRPQMAGLLRSRCCSAALSACSQAAGMPSGCHQPTPASNPHIDGVSSAGKTLPDTVLCGPSGFT